MYAPESIELLTKSGINFKRHEELGISVEHFGELLISSGLVLLDEVQWVSFHSWVSTFLIFALLEADVDRIRLAVDMISVTSSRSFRVLLYRRQKPNSLIC
jgi:hypothetical protein